MLAEDARPFSFMALLKGVRPVLHWGRDLFYRGQGGRVRSCPWTSAGVEAKRKEKKRKDIECYRRAKALDGWECWMLGYSRGYRETRCIPILYRPLSPKVVEVSKCSSKYCHKPQPVPHIHSREVTEHLKNWSNYYLHVTQAKKRCSGNTPPAGG